MKKLLLLIIVMMTQQAFAFSICDFNQTTELKEAIILELGQHDGRKTVSFSGFEKNLIFRTLKMDKRYKALTQEEAVSVFSGEAVKTLNTGVIDYFLVNNIRYTVVSHWPNQSESGAVYSLQGTKKAQFLAIITNGYISCR